MKIKFLAVLGLAAVAGLAGCKSAANTNANTNTVVMNTAATPSPITKTNESAATDPNLKANIEKALKAKGFNDVTVDVATTPATLRGTYPKDKIAEVMATATEANGGKPLKNEATGK